MSHDNIDLLREAHEQAAKDSDGTPREVWIRVLNRDRYIDACSTSPGWVCDLGTGRKEIEGEYGIWIGAPMRATPEETLAGIQENYDKVNEFAIKLVEDQAAG